MGKKVLVTGADGFIGSHLTEALVANGDSVRALTLYNSFNSWGWLDDVSGIGDQVEIVSGDVRDPAFCQMITKDIDVVYHLASLIAIPYSYHAPNSYVETNINGTLNMCQAARENNVERFIHTSTSEVYGTAQYVPIDERHPLQPQSPYSATKIAADALAQSFYNAFELPVTIARPFNTYGPRQSARAVIPSVIIQLLGKDRINAGDLSPTRDFNFVSDTCKGFITLASCDAAVGEVVNIGSNSEVSIADTIALIAELMGKEVEVSQEAQRMRPEKSEVFRLHCDNSKIISMTGYQPEVSLREGLQRTIDWFSVKENSCRYKADIYNV
ncbi:MAG: SDR family NAD(P)-dependent oxidoreductase [Gammaproteobacteria bacterium]|nr:SDR family NAD(P)-dependent oxidoreductase [Gammaproteobacteria bacterium]NKB65349.1 SDR family NAD(P)-dependent oxidoreductase [Gammaproteobacteria bacterium]